MKSKLYLSIAVIVVFIIGLVAIMIRSGQSTPVTNPDMTGGTSAPLETTNPNASQATSTTGTSYTLAQVAAHNSGSSCWTAINGGVYDVTNWISQHPGGPEAILSLCGKDGSAAFNGQHGGEARPAAELASFKIGTLAN